MAQGLNLLNNFFFFFNRVGLLLKQLTPFGAMDSPNSCPEFQSAQGRNLFRTEEQSWGCFNHTEGVRASL